MDTNLTKRQLRSGTLVAPTPRVLSPRQMISVDTTGLNCNIPQTEQDPSSHRFHSFENEGSHNDVKGCRAKIMKSNKTHKKPSPPFKSIKTPIGNLKESISRAEKWKSVFQHPKNQDNKDLVGLNARMMNYDADYLDTVIDPPQYPQNEADSSDDRAKETDASGGQVFLKMTFNKQTQEEVKRGILSQALLASI